MKEEKFKELENFPKKELEIKNRIRTSTYDLLEIAYEANSSKNVEHKEELLNKIMAKVKIIDFLINLSYDKKLITNKKYLKIAARLDDIAKYTNGWMKNISGQG